MKFAHAVNAMLVLLVLAVAAGVGWLYFGEQANETQAAAKPQPVAVVAKTVALQPLQDAIQVLGTARASEAITVTAEITGVVDEIHFQQSAVVEAGRILVTLASADAQASLQAAQAAVAQYQAMYARESEMHQSGYVADAKLEQTRTQLSTARSQVAVAEAALADHVIRAPFAGRLGLREVSVGSLVQPGTVITTLDDVTPIEVQFEVPGRFVGTLAPGQTIVAQSTAYPQTEFHGEVEAIATRVDPVTRTVAVRAVLANNERQLKPGMLLTMRLIRATAPALLIPELAVVAQNDEQFVFVVDDGAARRQTVQTGRRRPGWVEITSGLQPGDVVVTQGTLKLRDGTPVEREQHTAAAITGSVG